MRTSQWLTPKSAARFKAAEASDSRGSATNDGVISCGSSDMPGSLTSGAMRREAA